jgi:Sulfotransferase family
MMISVEKNFIFVHVAKTGGQAMKNVLRPYAIKKAGGQWRRLLSHLPVREALDAQLGPHTSASWARRKLPGDFFDHAFKFGLVRNPYDLAVSRYSFVRLHEGHHRHDDAQKQSFADFLQAQKRRARWRHKDQTAMLCDADGKLLVDKVYRFEAMADAYQDIVERLQLADAPPLTRKNASDRADYRGYYGDRERKLVEELWARDLDRFGYTF